MFRWLHHLQLVTQDHPYHPASRVECQTCRIARRPRGLKYRITITSRSHQKTGKNPSMVSTRLMVTRTTDLGQRSREGCRQEEGQVRGILRRYPKSGDMYVAS